MKRGETMIEKEFDHCPNPDCQGGMEETVDSTGGQGIFTEHMECNTCGTTWVQHYRASSINNIQIGGETNETN